MSIKASQETLSNKELVMEALKIDPNAFFYYSSEQLKNDKLFILEALK